MKYFIPRYKYLSLYHLYIKYKRYRLSRLNNIKENELFQLSSKTEYNRHPDLFKYSQNHFGKFKKINILSFGCSSGEECFSLREYFPNANIVGVDININSLRKANSNNTDVNIHFIHSSKFDNSGETKFNVIFANSVLCRQPECFYSNNLNEIYPFTEYEKIINIFDQLLFINGLLVIRFSNYSFEDTYLSNRYTCLFYGNLKFPNFDKSSNKIFSTHDMKGEIFKKTTDD